RERGLWSFLTWSFFLSQLAAGTAFASGAAQSAGNTADASSPVGTDNSNSNGTGLVGRPDFTTSGVSEPELAAAQSGASPVQPTGIFPAEKAGGIEQIDLTSDDAGLTQQSAMLPNS